MSDYELVSARYQTKKFEIANSLWTGDSHFGEDNLLNTDINLPDKHYHNDQHFNSDTNNRFLSENSQPTIRSTTAIPLVALIATMAC